MVEVSAASVGVLVEVHAASKLTVMVGEPLERVGNGDESPLSPLLDTSSAAEQMEPEVGCLSIVDSLDENAASVTGFTTKGLDYLEDLLDERRSDLIKDT